MKVYGNYIIIPVEALNPDTCNKVVSGLSDLLPYSFELGDALEQIPIDFYDVMRRQYDADRLLEYIAQHRHHERILAIIDADIFVAPMNFTFSNTMVHNSISLIALTRLRQEFYRMAPDCDVFIERVITESAHAIGTAIGLTQCSNETCIMHPVNTLHEVDAKKMRFCVKCRQRLKKLN